MSESFGETGSESIRLLRTCSGMFMLCDDLQLCWRMCDSSLHMRSKFSGEMMFYRRISNCHLYFFKLPMWLRLNELELNHCEV